MLTTLVLNVGKFMHTFQSLYKHRKNSHKFTTKVKIQCLEKNCIYTCHYLYQLRHHLTEVHEIEIEREEMTFTSYEGMIPLRTVKQVLCNTIQSHWW